VVAGSDDAQRRPVMLELDHGGSGGVEETFDFSRYGEEDLRRGSGLGDKGRHPLQGSLFLRVPTQLVLHLRVRESGRHQIRECG
jgi:hypothetical protein